MEHLQLGLKIQKLRSERGLSARKLSECAGITPSMLSQIENEQVNPSVNTLRAIAHALDVPMYTLFQQSPITSPIVHPDERLIIGSKNEPDVRYELLTRDTKGSIEFCLMVIPPQNSSYRDRMSHTGEEVAYVLFGKSVDLELNGCVYTLTYGDSVRIPPNTPHVWINSSDQTVQVIFAITPPTF